jgi:dimethylsulfoniopropionate demethylase
VIQAGHVVPATIGVTVDLTEGKLIGLSIIDPGAYYSEGFIITFSGGGGQGAFGVATVDPLVLGGGVATVELVEQAAISSFFGKEISRILFFRSRTFNYQGTKMLVARSGWSKQGGFEIYVNDAELGGQLWDELFAKGEDLNVGPGCPNLIERIESGLLSFGGDMGYDTTPFECGLDKYVSLDADIESLSLDELRTRKSKTKLIGIVIDRKVNLIDKRVFIGSNVVGKITSDTWSPRYSAFLAFARCELKHLEDAQNLHVKTTSGEVSARITDLPFDFETLGLTGIDEGTSI